jgi:hypothetical protein
MHTKEMMESASKTEVTVFYNVPVEMTSHDGVRGYYNKYICIFFVKYIYIYIYICLQY